MFDYIIIGAGSAGCALANRLSENPTIKVCLLEAGARDWHPLIHVPAGSTWMMRSKRMNWNYETEPEIRLQGRRLFWPRGKTLGGSSSSNAMVYTRGHKFDYDHWADLGNKGWGYKEILPYFKRSQNQERGKDDYHSVGGNLNVQDIEIKNKLSSIFVKAGVEAGFKANNDFNGKDQEGIGFFQLTQKNGRRCSTAKAFLLDAKKRPNLTIITKAHATRVIFKGKRATGVNYLHKGVNKEITLNASKEVILSGGAINSPQLLLLSGVGPKQEIEKHNLVTIHDLPGVGHNLQDHLDVLVVNKSTKPYSVGLTIKTLVTHSIYNLYQYVINKRGVLSTNGAEAGGFVKSDPSEKIPDLQFHFSCVKIRDHSRDTRFLCGHGYSLHVCNLRPKSRGRIRLNSSNPMDHPKIEANYLSDDRDIDALIKGVKASLKILNSPAFNDVRGKQLSPSYDLASDSSIREHILGSAESIYHPVGTCKMGHDNMAVVNDRLQVHGLEGLRVVDASIMPTIVGANTNAPTIAIAEKAADMILEDRGSML